MVKRSLGKKRIEFKLSAPGARRVTIAGDFNGWKADALSAKKDKKGTWRATVTVPAGTYEYKFMVDGSWLVDPSCSNRRVNAFGSENSVLVVK